jgi:hypothetical protein
MLLSSRPETLPPCQLELRLMREELIKRVNPQVAAEMGTLEEQWDALRGAAEGAAPHGHSGGIAAAGAQAAQAGGGGAGGSWARAAASPPPEEDLDDDELLALQAEEQWVRGMGGLLRERLALLGPFAQPGAPAIGEACEA